MSFIQSVKTRPGADCGSDHELLIAKFRLKLKKSGKTTKPFRYNLNQIPYDYKESWAPKNWCFWTVVLEKTLEIPLDCKEIQPVHPEVLSVHRKDWCWSWNSNTLATWCKELTHLKRPWCWERLKAWGEGDDRGWDGWMASPTQWRWVWVNSGSWWWTGRPGMPWSMGSQRVGHNWATELNWTYDYTVEMRNRFQEIDLIDRVPEDYGQKFITLYRRWWSKPSTRKRNARRQSGCLRRFYKQLRKEEKWKAREKEKDISNWMQSCREKQGEIGRSS